MRQIEKRKLVDPRTALFLLCMANVIAFTQKNIYVEITWVLFLVLLMVLGGGIKSGIKWLAFFGGILLLQYYILPISPKIIAVCFTIFANYARRLFPCFLVGAIIIKTISLREMIVAFRKLHFPEKLIIPIAVTIRYFPAMKEEVGYIHDAIVLRQIPLSDKLEAMLVPMMMSATETAEELAEAAVTRGIENPVRKTSGITLRMGAFDWCCMGISIIFAAIAWTVR